MKVMKVLIFGVGDRGLRLYNYLKSESDKYKVIAFLDNKQGGGYKIFLF